MSLTMHTPLNRTMECSKPQRTDGTEKERQEHRQLQGSPKESFPGCENVADKLGQMWEAIAVTKFSKPGHDFFWQSLSILMFFYVHTVPAKAAS